MSQSETGRPLATVSVSNDELVTVRDAMRGLNRMVDQLQSGEREQFVLMAHGRMVARLTPIASSKQSTSKEQ